MSQRASEHAGYRKVLTVLYSERTVLLSGSCFCRRRGDPTEKMPEEKSAERRYAQRVLFGAPRRSAGRRSSGMVTAIFRILDSRMLHFPSFQITVTKVSC